MQAGKDKRMLLAEENKQRLLASYWNTVNPTKYDLGGELLRITLAEFDEKVHCLHLLNLDTMPDTPRAKDHSEHWPWM
jgi:hypothetical protein